jgi:biotin carboxylase
MSPPVVAIVDPYSSGNMYAPALRRAGLSPVAITSWPAPARSLTGSFRPGDFDQCWSEEEHGRPGVTQRVARLSPVAIVPGTASGVELADALAVSLTPGRCNVPDLAPARRHKGAMVAAVGASGLPVARSVSAREPEDVERWIADEGMGGLDLVLKPAASAGTDGVVLSEGGHGWRHAMRRLQDQVNLLGAVNEEIVVQERLKGTEYCIDTFTCDGSHTVTNICRYGKVRNGENFALYEHVEFLPYENPGHPELIRYTERVLDALGIRFGPAHTEVIRTSSGPRLVETNARLAGGGIPAACFLATGDSGVDRLARYLSGTGEMQTWYRLQRCVLTVMFMVPRSGIIRNTRAYQEISLLPTCRYLRVNVRDGDHVPATSDLMSAMALGWALLADRDPRRVHADHAAARQIAAKVSVRPHTPTGIAQ